MNVDYDKFDWNNERRKQPKACPVESIDINGINADLSDSSYPTLGRHDEDPFDDVLEYMRNCEYAKKQPDLPDYRDQKSVQSKRLVGAFGSLGRLSFAQAEASEREEIIMLRDSYIGSMRWRMIHGLNDSTLPGHIKAKAISRQMTTFDEEIMKVMFHKMTTHVESHFHCIFPMGLEASGLNQRDVLALVDALVNMNTYFDQEMTTVTFACTPGMRFTVDQLPCQYRPLFYLTQAMKASVQLSGATQDEFIDAAIMYYHDRSKSAWMPNTIKQFFNIQDASLEAMYGSKEWQPMITEFYEACRALERKLMRVRVDENDEDAAAQLDNTISVDYQKGEAVGRGSYGIVYRCVNIQNGKFLALKELPLKECKDTEQEIRVEIDTLKSLHHDNIVKYYGCRFDRPRHKVSILMEYAPKSLRDVLLECHGLTFSLIAHYARRILDGLVYLHSKHVIHRDIKAANVLVTDSGDVKLSDFGSAVLYSEVDAETVEFDAHAETEEEVLQTLKTKKSMNNFDAGGTVTMTMGGRQPTADTDDDSEDEREAGAQAQLREKMKAKKARRAIVGTPLFMAPEILRGSLPNESSDIWAFGCLLIELVTGKQPWVVEFGGEKLPVPLTMYRISQATKPPQLPAELETSCDFNDFLYQCLAMNPNDRPTARALLTHPFVGGHCGHSGGKATSDGSVRDRSSSTTNSVTGMSSVASTVSMNDLTPPAGRSPRSSVMMMGSSANGGGAPKDLVNNNSYGLTSEGSSNMNTNGSALPNNNSLLSPIGGLQSPSSASSGSNATPGAPLTGEINTAAVGGRQGSSMLWENNGANSEGGTPKASAGKPPMMHHADSRMSNSHMMMAMMGGSMISSDSSTSNNTQMQHHGSNHANSKHMMMPLKEQRSKGEVLPPAIAKKSSSVTGSPATSDNSSAVGGGGVNGAAPSPGFDSTVISTLQTEDWTTTIN